MCNIVHSNSGNGYVIRSNLLNGSSRRVSAVLISVGKMSSPGRHFTQTLNLNSQIKANVYIHIQVYIRNSCVDRVVRDINLETYSEGKKS